jgi:glycerate dehydrogenase
MMNPQIVVLDGHTLTPNQPGSPPLPGEPRWDALQELGELTVYPRTPPDQVLDRIGEASIVLTNKTVLSGETLRQAGSVRYLGVMATGMNVIDLDAAEQLDITVKNAPGYGTDSVAQHVFALILELANRVAAHHESVERGAWSACEDFCYTVAPLIELQGKTLGIVGLGAIGRRVARLGHAFGMNLQAAHQRSMHDLELDGLDVDWRPLDELTATSDVLTLHCPLNDDTHHLIDADRLERMKPGAFLINTGRGPLIDEAALAAALRSGQIAGAGLDVLSQEPPAADHPLYGCPNLFITPHIAWATRESRQRLMDQVVDNVRAFCNA